MANLKPSVSKQTFPVTGMTCAACASSVETILTHTEGIQSATVNYATTTVAVVFDEQQITVAGIDQALQDVGYGLVISSKELHESVREAQEQKYSQLKIQTIGAGLATLPIVILGMLFMDWIPGRWISLFLCIPVLFYFGRHFFTNAWKQLRHGKASMDTLVALSTSIAFLFSAFSTLFPDYWQSRGLAPHVYFEAAAVIVVFVSLGKVLEEGAKTKTGAALKKLMGLQPKTLTRFKDGKPEEILLEDVRLGDLILVKPGEKVPIDGLIQAGNSYLDESMLTGEFLAVIKEPGDRVFAGTLNQKGSLEIIAEKVGKTTLLAQIIHRVEEAQGSKAPVQQLVDKIAGIFVPIVLGIALLTFGAWMVFGGEHALSYGLLSAVSVLVIACPCALGLATPTALMVGIGKGAENQLLIRDAASLELAHRVNALVLDKTGTLTEGKPKVVQIITTTDPSLPSSATQEAILMALERKSAHPLAEAVAQHVKEKELPSLDITDFEDRPGHGIQGKVEGVSYMVGNKNFLLSKGLQIPSELASAEEKWTNEAQTLVWLGNETQALALLGIADEVKANAGQVVKLLQADGIEVFLLTGDNKATAAAVARQVGITNYQGETLPADKSNFIKELQQKGLVVAMVGDGINDAEALAQADVSIAMGKGSDIAMDVAMITLITSDLAKIPQAFRLSKITVRGIQQNLFWAFVYNIIGIPIAAGVLYPAFGFLLDPMIAAGAMALSSVSVVTNSLRLKTKKLS
jgi:Cu2+-exporting ATPase